MPEENLFKTYQHKDKTQKTNSNPIKKRSRKIKARFKHHVF